MSCTALRESVGGQRPTRGRRRGNHMRAVVGKVIPGRGVRKICVGIRQHGFRRAVDGVCS